MESPKARKNVIQRFVMNRTILFLFIEVEFNLWENRIKENRRREIRRMEPHRGSPLHSGVKAGGHIRDTLIFSDVLGNTIEGLY